MRGLHGEKEINFVTCGMHVSYAMKDIGKTPQSTGWHGAWPVLVSTSLYSISLSAYSSFLLFDKTDISLSHTLL